MKIGVISDTHIPIKCCELPPDLIKGLKGADLILHAGDLVDACVLEELKKITKVEAVCGNMDPENLKNILEDKKTLNVEGKKICMTHGFGPPDNLVNVLKNEFAAQKPDIIVFGHSHVPMNKCIDGILFFNPGSATDTVFTPYRSFGVIEIEKGQIKATIHKL